MADGVFMRTCLISSLLSCGLAFSQSPATGSLPVASNAAMSNSDVARGLLDSSLKDKNPDTRMHAVQALGLVSPTEPYLSQLEAMLDDKDVLVRLATIT